MGLEEGASNVVEEEEWEWKWEKVRINVSDCQ
jgi:hypothetical protein